MAISECPQCTCHIPLETGADVGDVISCPDCGAALKLVSQSPPLFKAVGEE